MKCYKCGNEMTITNRMDSSGGMSSYRQTAYCNICKESIDLGTNFASEKKKDSTLSIVAAVLAVFKPVCFIGIIVGIIDLIVGRNDGKRHLGLLISIIFCIIWGIMGVKENENNEVPQNEVAVQETAKEEPKKEVKKEAEKTEKEIFVEKIGKYVSKKDARKTYNVYVNKLGFSSVEFEKRMGETNNFVVTASGYSTVATVLDGYIRIFIPDTSHVFYEGGKVIETLSEMEDGFIDSADLGFYYSIAKEIVEKCLVAPKTADFPSKSEILYQKSGNLVAISGYVDSKNALGVELRSQYIVQFYVNDLKNFLYDVVYVRIDDKETGEFIEYE